MSSRRKTEARCKICLLRLEKCICAEIADARQLIHSKTPIRIIMHYKEARLPTNTGRLAKELMQDCEIWLRGAEDDTRNWEESVSSLENPIYLYPSEKAEILNAFAPRWQLEASFKSAQTHSRRRQHQTRDPP